MHSIANSIARLTDGTKNPTVKQSGLSGNHKSKEYNCAELRHCSMMENEAHRTHGADNTDDFRVWPSKNKAEPRFLQAQIGLKRISVDREYEVT